MLWSCVTRTPHSNTFLCRKQRNMSLQHNTTQSNVSTFFFILWTYIHGDFCDSTTYTMYQSQNWICHVWCLLLCITSIMCACPTNSAASVDTALCLCNAGFFADTTNPLSCSACPVMYNANELTEAHANDIHKNCIEIYQDP